MPSVLTHYGFNKEVFTNKVQFLKDNEDIYLVGAQGPDPFFFCGIVPLITGCKNSKEIRKFGTSLHKMEPSKVFEYFFEYADKKKEKDILYSYILGAGLHYILDRKIHPYVFYKTGFSDDPKQKKKYFANHTLFETHLDVLLMNGRYKDYKTTSIESIKCNDDKIEEVSEMYEKMSKEILNETFIDDDSFEDSYDDMLLIEKLLYSKRGIKKAIVNTVFKNTPFDTMMHPLKVKDADVVDYLNTKKDIWKDPSTEVEFNKSFDELLDEAKLESSEWIKLVCERYEGNSVNLEEFTKSFIYDGYKAGNKMKVFNSVYKKEEKKK